MLLNIPVPKGNSFPLLRVLMTSRDLQLTNRALGLCFVVAFLWQAGSYVTPRTASDLQASHQHPPAAGLPCAEPVVGRTPYVHSTPSITWLNSDPKRDGVS